MPTSLIYFFELLDGLAVNDALGAVLESMLEVVNGGVAIEFPPRARIEHPRGLRPGHDWWYGGQSITPRHEVSLLYFTLAEFLCILSGVSRDDVVRVPST